MKKLIILIALFFVGTQSQAQEHKTSLGGAKKVVFVLSHTDLSVEAYDGNEVIIEAKGYEKPPKRADGLKPLYNTAQDNTGVGLAAHNEGGVLKFVRSSSRQSIDYRVKLPRKVDLVIEEANWNGGDYSVKGMRGEIEIKAKNADIMLDDVTGPIVANSTSGNVQVVFSSLSDKPSAITSTSGYVDVTLPKNAKADLVLKVWSGEIYTDFDVLLKKEDGKDEDKEKRDHEDKCWRCDYEWGRGAVKGQINGGGVEINLKATSGDIYLRQAK